MKRILVLATVGAAVTVSACTDATRATEPPQLPPSPPVLVSHMRGTADLVAGTLTFEKVPAAPGASTPATVASPAIYGAQGITVRIYNSPVIVTNPSTPGKKTYAADVGVRNLLAHPIGDEQGGLAPQDTNGIFVFVNGAPTVRATSSACSPSCSVRVANAHGVLAFNAPSQQYWYWNDQLTAAGGVRDTTLTRRRWSFEADTQVTHFSFDVLVSAAWPAPHETRWKVEFPGDSLPHLTTEPRWRRTTSGTGGTITLDSPGAGNITMTASDASSNYFSRRDSLSSTSAAYMEARFRRNSAGGDGDTSFGIDDNQKFIAVGVKEDRVGFLKQDYGFIGFQAEVTGLQFHTYRIRKFGADSVQLLVDGVRVDSRAYTAFENSSAATVPSFLYFGIPGVGTPPKVSGAKSASWDYVIYEIGATQP